MDKRIVTLILVIFISFCFLSIVVADSATHDVNNTTDHDKTIDKDKHVDKDTTDKNKTTDKNQTKNESKKNYIIALGSGNDIMFSDGFRGFAIDHSKPLAKSGDEFKRASTSKVGNSNSLKLAIIESYRQLLAGDIEDTMDDFSESGSSDGKVGAAVASSHEKIGDHAVVKIDDETEAVFNFEVLQSVSGNVSDYFAYTVSFRNIDDDNLNQTNLTNITNVTNITNATNITNMTLLFDNDTNLTLLMELIDFLLYWGDLLFDAWEPIIETLLNDFLIFYHALEELVNLFENFMVELQSFMDAVKQFLNMLDALWKEIDGLLKLVGILLTAIQQLINLIVSILNYIVGLIYAIIALIQQLLGLLFALLNFILDLINQIIALIQAIIDFLKTVGSVLVEVIGNALILVSGFVIITIGAFLYNRIRK